MRLKHFSRRCKPGRETGCGFPLKKSRMPWIFSGRSNGGNALGIGFLAFSSVLSAAHAAPPQTETKTLETPRYVVTITQRCEEYVVGCDHVTYHGVSRKSGSAIDLKGEQVWHKCADGVTPCHLIGWRFRRGATQYFVSDEGSLEVTQAGKSLLRETGTWKE